MSAPVGALSNDPMMPGTNTSGRRLTKTPTLVVGDTPWLLSVMVTWASKIPTCR